MDPPHRLIPFRLGVAAGDRPSDQTGDTVGGARLALGVDLRQPVGPELRNIEKHMLAGVDFDGRDAEFWVDRIICAAGHRYDLVDNTRTVYRQAALGEMWE